jgi:pimeloyl-ACP methyl ester carboxylesterase
MTSQDGTAHRSVWTHMIRTPFRQDYIDAGGVRTRYVQAGPADAPALIMLHGTAGTWEGFCANVPAHAEHFNCYAIDMVGSGFSSKPDVDYEIPVYVEHVRNFMKAVGLKKASFIGVSLGAWIASKLAIDHPEMVDKLVLLAASGLFANKSAMGDIRARRGKAVEDPSWENIKAIFTSLILDERNRIADIVAVRQASYRQPEMKRAMEHVLCLQDPDIRPRNLIPEEDWKKITAPALVIAAPDDKDVFYQTALQVSKLMPNAQMIEKKGVAHWAHFEEPEFFNRVSIEFLRS